MQNIADYNISLNKKSIFSMKKKNLIVRIEIQKRDLEGRFLLSLIAALNGYRVFLGNASQLEWAIKNKFIKESIIIENSVAKAKTSYLNFLVQNKNKVFSIDEEGGLVYEDYSDFLKLRSSEKNVIKSKKIFCWGKFDYSAWKKKYKKFSKKFIITGSPRADLWNKKISICYKKDVDKIKKKFGKFILITTNFVYGNSLINVEKQIKTRVIRDFVKSDKNIKTEMNFFNEDRKMFKEFVDLITYLGKNLKKYKIILRPHPVENEKSYKNKFKNNNKIIIDNSGYIVPWLKASSVVIQNGCQTGLEAYGLKRPVISYVPFNRGKNLPKGISKTVPALLSKRIRNKKNLLNFLSEERHLKIKNFNKNIFKKRFSISKQLASEKIIKVLNEYDNEKTTFNINSISFLIKDIKNLFRKILNYFQQSKLYLKKNEPIKVSELLNQQERFAKYDSNFNKIKIRKLYDGLFCLYLK